MGVDEYTQVGEDDDWAHGFVCCHWNAQCFEGFESKGTIR